MKYFSAAIALLLTVTVFSQSEDLYNSSSIPEELKVKANAVVRYENKVVEILSSSEIKVVTKRITTVFNKYGNRDVNAVQFYDNHTEIEEIYASIYDSYGNLVKFVKERDFTDASAVSNISIYEDDRVKYLDYTPLNYPYTVEFDSEVIHRNTAFFPDWKPIDDFYLSVEHSEYKVINTAEVELKTKTVNFEDFNITENSEHAYVIKNAKGIKYENYTPELSSIVPQYKLALKRFNMAGVMGINNNWKEFGKWMHDSLLLGTDKIPQSTIDEVRTITSGVDDAKERAKIVYKYMQDKTRYISIQVGIGGWKPMVAGEVDALGYSDCKGLTNYTKALLNAVDVPAYYTVVYGGESIRNIDPDFSSIQGNHVILCLPYQEENIFLECTSQTNPFGFIAGFTDDRDVLIVKPEGGEIVHTKVYNAEDSVQATKSNVVLNENGSFEAHVNIETTGYQYGIHEGLERKTERDQQLYYKEYWDYINDLSIDKITIENDKENIVYKEQVVLASSSYASSGGNRLIFEPNMFNRVTALPTRYLDRQLRFKIPRAFKDIDEYVIQLPDNYKVEAIAEAKTISNRFGTYEFKIELLDDNRIKYTRIYSINKGEYEKEAYKEYRNFLKQIVKSDKSKIALIKA
ncbi:MAG: hypothetical protein Tsb0033_05550 [Winogradskyella sp.]